MKTAVAAPDPDDGPQRMTSSSITVSVLSSGAVSASTLSSYSVSVSHTGALAVSASTTNRGIA